MEKNTLITKANKGNNIRSIENKIVMFVDYYTLLTQPYTVKARTKKADFKSAWCALALTL